MKISNSLNAIMVMLLSIVFLFSFSSCRSTEENETTMPAGDAFDMTETFSENITEAESADNPSGEMTTAESETTTAAQAQTQTQTQTPSETKADNQTQPQTVAPETRSAERLTGTVTVNDGNKTIVYPAELKSTDKKYPVIVWANGTGCPTQSYMSLLQKLAEGGYIVVADSTVMSADGTAQISSIDYILDQNKNSSSVFYSKVNPALIGACGHSQGGRSCINAAQSDPRIRCVVSIAGASSTDESRGLKTPCLFLTGTGDLVVVSSQWCKPSYDAVSGKAAYASLKGGVHTTCMTNPEKVSGYTLSWFDAYLMNDKSARSVFSENGKLAHDSAWQDFRTKN